MIKFSDCSKFATDPNYSEARGTCCGLAIFFATLLALGVIAVLSAGLNLHGMVSVSGDVAPPAYAQLTVADGI